MSATARGRDPGASMSLITELMTHPLDPSYEAAAAARERRGLPRSTGLRSPFLIIVCVLTGVALAASALALRVPLGVAEQRHDQLVGSIQSRQQKVDKATRRINGLQQEIARYQKEALGRAHRGSLSDRLTTLGVATGTIPADGPGLKLVVDDAEEQNTDADGDPRTGDSDGGRVTSSDMQIIVNGLWQAGAEAVSINGQRLTAESAIRFAGEAILVNFRPLQPPYTITAVGAGDTMKRKFQQNIGGIYLKGLVDSYGITEKLTTHSTVHVPAGPAPSLIYAKVPKEKK